MNILALDIGTKCGWAVADDSASPLPTAHASAYGKQDTGLLMPFNETAAIKALRLYHHGLWKPSVDGLTRGRHYNQFGRWLAGHVQKFQIGLIGAEFNAAGVANMKNQDAALKTFGIYAVVEAVADDAGIRATTIHTASMQLHAVGTGRDTEKKKRRARLNALGLDKVGGDEGDAIFALSWLLNDLQSRRREAA